MGRPGKMKARPKRQGGLPKSQQLAREMNGLTMQQAARNTEGHGRDWSGSRLRYKAIRFVGATDRQPDNTEEDIAEQKPEDSQQDKDLEPENHTQEAEDTVDQGLDDTNIFIDLSGENVKQPTGLPNPVTRLSSPDLENPSDEEIIVFRGRNKGGNPITSREQIRIVEDVPDLNISERNYPTIREMESTEPPKSSLDVSDTNGPSPDDCMASLPSTSMRSASMDNVANVNSTELNQRPVDDERQETFLDDVDIMADYIANIDEDYAESERMGTPDSDDVPVDNLETRQSPPASDNSTDTESLDATQRDGIEQNGETHTRHDRSNEDWPDIADINLGSDLDLDFDDFDSDLEFNDISISSEEGLKDLVQSRRRRSDRWKQPFPSASSFADALESDPYYGLDIMDFGRPSLKNKGKGKRATANLMLSDSELEEELDRAWRNDRNKKKSRKKTRQELRSQGLLGRNAENPDLKARYSDGMTVSDLRAELRRFLLSSRENLPLPPMDKQRRKVVHDLANALSLKSQSRGNGNSRFPNLYKTSRTPDYTPRTIYKFEKLFSGSKFGNRLMKTWGIQPSGKSTKTPRGPGGRPKAAVSYTDGDVVGASAPEIGAENKGRAMLEKMGWSTGTALGAVNNKGILQPVAHVVKNSRVGLG